MKTALTFIAIVAFIPVYAVLCKLTNCDFLQKTKERKSRKVILYNY